MNYIKTFFCCLFLSAISIAMNDNNKNGSHQSKSTKELEKMNSIFFSKKKDKKVSFDDSETESVTYQSLQNLVKTNDGNKLKAIILENPDRVLLTNEHGENIMFYLAKTNNVRAMETIASSIKPDLVLHAINARSNNDMAALHVASENGAHAAATYLLSLGAFVDLAGPAKITPYVMALNRQDLVMACIMTAFGARVTMAPLDDDQKLVKILKLFSSEARNFIVDIFSGKNGLKLDANCLELLADRLRDLVKMEISAHNLNKNLNTYKAHDSAAEMQSNSLIDQLLSEAEEGAI